MYYQLMTKVPSPCVFWEMNSKLVSFYTVCGHIKIAIYFFVLKSKIFQINILFYILIRVFGKKQDIVWITIFNLYLIAFNIHSFTIFTLLHASFLLVKTMRDIFLWKYNHHLRRFCLITSTVSILFLSVQTWSLGTLKSHKVLKYGE